MTGLNTISPERAAALVDQGAVLVDVRPADEHARENIPGAHSLPLDRVRQGLSHQDAKAVIFHCRSGMRTQSNAPLLAQAAHCEAFILEGGIEGWKKAGLPVVFDSGQPLDLMRQVQITVGLIVLTSVLLGAFVAPAFYIPAALAGAGLLVAGLTGFCGMASLLAAMPWNRRLHQT